MSLLLWKNIFFLIYKSYIKRKLKYINKKCLIKKKPIERDFFLTATTAAGAVGIGAAVWPLVDQMNPDASVKALASTEVDISSSRARSIYNCFMER